MNTSLYTESKTWDGWRWLFVLLAAVFAVIAFWLALSGSASSSPAVLLLVVPVAFALGSLAVAAFASDTRIQRIATIFQAFS